jgi:indole-3-glycerol phosphate synthase
VSLLDRIVAAKKEEVKSLSKSKALPVQSRFGPALRRAPGSPVRVIAECKRTSPSSGRMREDYNPEIIAKEYAALGAAALSVLTDREFFEGQDEHLALARKSGLPVLRKDFVIDERQIHQTAALQADAVLLIVRILDRHQLTDYLHVAEGLGLAALVETHNEPEIERALECRAKIVGINHRDLDTLKMDLSLTPRLAPEIRRHHPAVVLVAESGVESAEGLGEVEAFADAVLMGTAFMKSSSISDAWKKIFGRLKAD